MHRPAVREVVAVYGSDHSMREAKMLDCLGDVPWFERV
jgi:hypothetical protein